MNFDDAIKAHSSWKLKLGEYLRKPDGSLKADQIKVDNTCELGKWIYGEGLKYKDLPEYQSLVKDHAKFHKAAADVVIKADSGKDVKEDTALGAKSDFSNASTAVVTAIMSMRSKVK